MSSRSARPEGRILCLATKGSGSNDEARIITLLSAFEPDVFAFDRGGKLRSFLRLLSTLRRERPPLVVLEGTGVAGGVALILARLVWNIRFVISSGDAVAPFLASRSRLLFLPAIVYERLLCRLCAGFIGWTPYLVGRALTFGAPRAMTAEGSAWHAAAESGAEVRARLGIPQDATVFGIVGALVWNQRLGYCYGWELIEALRRCRRPDVWALIVGDGSGLERLRALSAGRERVVFTGAVPQSEVPSLLGAMDVATLPQSVDGVGAFRYTTKLPEYAAAGVTVAMNHIPAAYDLGPATFVRLPGDAPWSDRYIEALSALMDGFTTPSTRGDAESAAERFNLSRQVERTTAFVSDLLRA